VALSLASADVSVHRYWFYWHIHRCQW